MRMRAVGVELRGLRIAALLTQPDEPSDRCVVLVHGGPGGTKDGPSDLFVALAARLAEEGLASIRFDMLGAGESDGDYAEMTLACQAEQLALIVELAMVEGYHRLGVVAESLGAAVALLGWPSATRAAALLWPCIDLIDTSLKTYLDDQHVAELRAQGFLLDEGIRVGRLFVEEFQRLGNLEDRLSAVHVPALLIHGQADNDVPSYQSQRAYQLLREPKRLVLVPNGEHGLRLPQEQALVGDEIVNWFKRYLVTES